MKTCEEYQELISAYVDGETTDAEIAEVFFHLGSCRECRSFISSVLKLQSLLQEPRAGATVNHSQHAYDFDKDFSASKAHKTDRSDRDGNASVQLPSLRDLNAQTPASQKADASARLPWWKRKFPVPLSVAAAVVALVLVTGGYIVFEKPQSPIVIDRTHTSYVYISSLPLTEIVAS
ncbi:MAG TPA: zf-HC2 domain-containing protein, partial [Bacteroidota bacterium]|nr:zf-HC2 domain-containing protein [Bacteroidota bacterium]